jgi:hypothetical protein
MAGRVPSIQGKQYPNRKDLQNSPRRKPAGSPPAGGIGIPGAAQREIAAQVAPQPQAQPGPDPNTYAMDSVPNLDDPTGRPQVPTQAGLDTFKQDRSKPVPEAIRRMQELYQVTKDPDLARVLDAYWTKRDNSDDESYQNVPINEIPGGRIAWTTVF